jgi:hypothetical protein
MRLAVTRKHAVAAGALALGAFAVGAVAVGALAIGRLAIGRARIRRLEVDELVVRRLRIQDPGSGPELVRADEVIPTLVHAVPSSHPFPGTSG